MKKPGRMRWEYTEPEEKVFVTDGAKTYFYLPAENQVMVSHQPQGAMGMEEGSPFELLAGRGHLRDSFHPALSDEPATRGGTVVRLEPTRPREEFELVELEVDPSTGRVLRVVLIDSASNRSLSSASEAFEISSRKKISLWLYSEWIISFSSCLTSA